MKKIKKKKKYILKTGWIRNKWILRLVMRSRLVVLMAIFCLVFSILIVRLFYLQIVKGAEYAEEFVLQIRKTQEIKATRGNIYDRNGNLLAYNELAYSVTIEDPTSSDESTSQRNETINQILDQVLSIVEKNGDSIINSFGITLDNDGNYQFSQTSETQRLRFVADVYGYTTIDELSEEQTAQTADELIEYLCTDETYGYGLDYTESDHQYILDMVNMRYAMHLNSYQQYIKTTIAMDVSKNTAAAINENKDVLTGVEVTENSIRKYTDPEVFSSIIGYTGQISEAEYDVLSEEEQENTSKTDIVGKDGIEKAFDDVLRGTNGEITFYVNNLGNVTETVSTKEATAGNDLYLTIDSDLQTSVYQLLEEKLAGIILSKLENVLTFDTSTTEDSSDIIIPVGDAYYSFIGNYIVDYTEFEEDDAGEAEQEIYSIFSEKRANVCEEIMAQLNNSSAQTYDELPDELKSYMDYISNTVLGDNTGLMEDDAVDTEDETYIAWTKDGSISLYTYLHHAISQNWIDTSLLEEGGYSDSDEIYQDLLDYIENYISDDSSLDLLVYEDLIRSGTITGEQICATVYEQGVLEMDEEIYNSLRSGEISAYSWLRDRIENLDITPGQLALEPCSGGVVVTDPNTGDVLACVSYPGYDNNRLANTMDTEYYSQLVNGMNNIFYNRATQEKTAPGSTYKMVSAVAALTEGVINGNSTVYCSGKFTKVTPSPKCWIYPSAHGSLNIVGALQNSCNDFFYEMGYRLGTDENGNYDSDRGIETLRKYAEMFGLGETTGMEITEAKPEISDEYAVQSAIGQGTNNFTVSQLSRYVTAVANRGTVYSLTFSEKITDSEGSLIKEYENDVVNTMDCVNESTWDLVQTGMENMVKNSSTFEELDFSMAGKTGTAQQSALHPDHALFVGYAPADSPDIAFAVRITYGYSSSYAAEVGRDIARIWFNMDSADEILTGKAAELGQTLSGD